MFRLVAAGAVLAALALVPAATSAGGGLVAAYGFEEGSGSSVADASGNGHTGSISGATWASAGKFGKALSFNGSNAMVTVPDAADLHLSTAMTLEAWVNPASVTSDWRDVIYKGNDNYYLGATTSSSGKPAAGSIIGGSYAEAYGTSALATGAWTHLAMTYDGTAVRLFVNGTQVASTAKTGTIASSTNPLQIGGDSIYGQFFSGLIDEVRIYNVALTATQIQADMAAPVVSGSGDGQVPSAPGTLTATAAGSTGVSLSWGAATDNVGVTGYQVERCQGAGCSTVRSGRDADRHDLRRLGADGGHELQLPRPCDRRGRQPRPLRQHRDRDDRAGRRRSGAVGAGDVDGDRGGQYRREPELGRGDRQRRRHRLPGRALPGRGLLQLSSRSRRRPARPSTTPG